MSNNVIDLFGKLDATSISEFGGNFKPESGKYTLRLSKDNFSLEPHKYTNKQGVEVVQPSISFRWTVVGGPNDGKTFYEDRFEPRNPNEPGLEAKIKNAIEKNLGRLRGNLRVLTGQDEVSDFAAAIVMLQESLNGAEHGITVNASVNNWQKPGTSYVNISVFVDELVSID